MAIFLTGDTHGRFERFSAEAFPLGKELTKEDYVIILGDFGGIWESSEENKNENYWLKWLDEKPWTTLFIDGNHENYDRLNTYEITKWCGGDVQFIRPSIIHLLRGQVYNIDGTTFYTMGGASSHDIKDGILEIGDPRIKQWYRDYTKLFRINRLSWWKEELPNDSDFFTGNTNLQNVNYKVDYILSHSPSTTEQVLMCGGNGLYEPDRLTNYLDEVMAKTEFKRHYFGHMHVDRQVTHNAICLYNNIERVA